MHSNAAPVVDGLFEISKTSRRPDVNVKSAATVAVNSRFMRSAKLSRHGGASWVKREGCRVRRDARQYRLEAMIRGRGQQSKSANCRAVTMLVGDFIRRNAR